MTKTRKTITIDGQLADLVDQHGEFNLSGFVNECLEQHFANGNASSPKEAALKAELERIETELQDVETKESRLRDRRETIEERLDEKANDEPELLGQARESLAETPRDPSNPAIQNWASKLGVPSEQLIEMIDGEAYEQSQEAAE